MAANKQRILVVDDDENVRNLISAIFEGNGLDVITAETGPEGLAQASAQPVDLVLLDIALPGMDGFEVCRRLKEQEATRSIPIMLITGRESVEDKVLGFGLGATDYINKPFDTTELRARVHAVLRSKRAQDQWVDTTRHERKRTEHELLRIGKAMDSASDAITILDASGEHLYHNISFQTLFDIPPEEIRRPESMLRLFRDAKSWESIQSVCRTGNSWKGEVEIQAFNGRLMSMLLRADAIKDDHAQYLGSVFIFTDITERKRLEKDLIYLASHDPLTRLKNRRSFTEQLERGAMDARLGMKGALLYLDLDHFKNINDTLSHQAGDRLLIDIARLLPRLLRPTDLLARLGGDEFAVLLANTSLSEAELVAKRINQFFDGFRFSENGRYLTTSVSIGLSLLDDSISAETAMAQADAACNLAKAKGRNRYEVFCLESSEIPRLSQEANLAPLIKDALQKNALELWLQPIVPLSQPSCERYEVLLRMRDQAGNMIGPGVFVIVAERLGIMKQIDHWVFRHALAVMAKHPHLQFNLNLSAQTMNDPDLTSLLKIMIADAGVAPSRLTFEITETAMIFNLSAACTFLKDIKEFGCGTALDDFGSGFTSLSYLRQLPVDFLKIDGSFVQNLSTDRFNQTLVRAISDIAHLLGMQTVVEYVENELILETARGMGVDHGQGWHLGKPRPISDVC
jgi:diguanylate cyclase (GGDEF)-like protein/PAS domain S-box-containing protein